MQSCRRQARRALAMHLLLSSGSTMEPLLQPHSYRSPANERAISLSCVGLVYAAYTRQQPKASWRQRHRHSALPHTHTPVVRGSLSVQVCWQPPLSTAHSLMFWQERWSCASSSSPGLQGSQASARPAEGLLIAC